eukprot:4138736-Pleurochrysis_carterae.AAC.1
MRSATEIGSAASGGRLEPCHKWARRRGRCESCRPVRWSRSQAVNDNRRLRRAQVRFEGRPRRNPIGASRGLVVLQEKRVCVAMWRASWRKRFARNLLQVLVRSLEHRA